MNREDAMMYSYHNRIKQRVAAGELEDHYYTDNYPNIGAALVLVFNTPPYQRPIRPHKFALYEKIIGGVKYAADNPADKGRPRDQETR